MTIAAFAIDRHEVTNDQFAVFVAATGYVTGYVTGAERAGGGPVFAPPTRPVPLDNAARWWRYAMGADWRPPRGPRSTIEGHGASPWCG